MAATSPVVTDAPGDSAGGRRLLTWVREAVVVVVAALVLSLLVKTFLVQAFWIPSPSMEDTLVRGDRVVVSRLTPGPLALHRGDVVVFADPGGRWLEDSSSASSASAGGRGRNVVATAIRSTLTFVGVLPDGSQGHLVKRVIGLPGDRVACCTAAGLTTINGRAVHEPYLAAGAAPSQIPFAVTVPAHSVWVEGDNRPDSADSRRHQDLPGGGSVPEGLIVGRAVARVWPLDRVGWLSDYPEAFSAVPAPR